MPAESSSSRELSRVPAAVFGFREAQRDAEPGKETTPELWT